MTSRISGSTSYGIGSGSVAFFVAALVDLLFYGIYRAWLNPSGLLESDDLFYFELAKTSIREGYMPVVHLGDLNRAIVFIIQMLFELFEWSDPSLFVCIGIVLYWFAAYKLFGNHASFSAIVLVILAIYPDVIYLRYHMFKDIVLVSLVALSVHYYEQRNIPAALVAALLCAPFRFYLFPLIVVSIFLLRVHKLNWWHLIILGILLFAFTTQVDLYAILSSSIGKEVFASGGDYTVKRVAESVGISNSLLLMPLVALSFFLQPAPYSLVDSHFGQIVPYSFLSTYFLLIPAMIYIVRHQNFIKKGGVYSAKFVFCFTLFYVLTFAFDPVLADMRHRAILVLPFLMIFFRVRWIRAAVRQRYIPMKIIKVAKK